MLKADAAKSGIGAEAWESDLGRPGWWMRVLLFAAFAGGSVGVIGFLSGDLLICLFDWTGMIVIGTALAAGLLPRAIRTGRRFGLPLGLSAALAIAVTAAPIALVAALFSAWAWPKEVGRMSPADWYIKTLLVEAFIVAGWVMLEQLRRGRGAPVPVLAAPRASAQGDVFCLQMEDHYVRIHTPRGSSIELMPMKAAIARYGGPEGLRVHRSWWVARDAIRDVQQEGRNWRLVLDGGLIVPVARSSIMQVRALKLA
ncbi:MAG TPA: LytTR family DNA-binding domain-containing protein [Sphingomonas sp.]|uniref:LytTR family DNA-binding domain-containing protein n=1 Tax=Sphingomonas sp. TaxID=28214 RepID=UPI002CAF39C1|nr:LytTR family DNA-binding domain-containing protein [Sphingomonas sp.]HMI19519.1 LytTR family DNA-binding domain-containing protein [Sphingomonas sp.]